MFSAPTEYAPWRPLRRVPPRIGSACPSSDKPIRREKNRRISWIWLVRPAPKLPPPPLLRSSPKEKIPWFSRKKSRFSGKNRLKRVRFTCCSSASTCEKSVLTVKSHTSPDVTPYFTSTPPWKSPAVGRVAMRLPLVSAYGFTRMVLHEAVAHRPSGPPP